MTKTEKAEKVRKVEDVIKRNGFRWNHKQRLAEEIVEALEEDDKEVKYSKHTVLLLKQAEPLKKIMDDLTLVLNLLLKERKQ